MNDIEGFVPTPERLSTEELDRILQITSEMQDAEKNNYFSDYRDEYAEDALALFPKLLNHIEAQKRELAIHYDPPGFAPFWLLLDEDKYDEAETILRQFQREYPDNLSLIRADTHLAFWMRPLDPEPNENQN